MKDADADVDDDLNDVDADVHLAKVWFPWIRFAHWLVAAEAAKFDSWSFSDHFVIILWSLWPLWSS